MVYLLCGKHLFQCENYIIYNGVEVLCQAFDKFYVPQVLLAEICIHSASSVQ